MVSLACIIEKLRKLKNEGHFDGDVYEKIYPTSSQPERNYGLPKIHEIKGNGDVSPPPLRPSFFNRNL